MVLKLTPNEPKMNPNEPKMTHDRKNTIDPKMNPNEPKMNPNEPKNIHHLKTKEYICSYCGNSYSTNSHMRRHEKTCKIKIEKENEKDKKIEELIKNQEEMKEIVEKLLLEKSNTITNNNTNIIIQQTIQ